MDYKNIWGYVIYVHDKDEKYGIIHKARELFNKIHDATKILYTAMIRGYAIHGYRKDAKCVRTYNAWELFDKMHDENIVSFLLMVNYIDQKN